jgi:hypothetical protein
MLSGLQSYYDPRHHFRRERENQYYKSTTEYVSVETKTLKTIFNENNVKQVNYLSIDVEGGELAVIESIDFDQVFIDVIGFENNYPDTGEIIVEYLKSKGYSLINFHSYDILMIHNDSKFKL